MHDIVPLASALRVLPMSHSQDVNKTRKSNGLGLLRLPKARST